MGRAQPDPKFPDTVWDGLTRSTQDPNVEVPADIDFNARYRAEIRAIEEILLGYLEDLEVIHNYGDPNYVLTVKDDGTGIEWAESGGGGDIGILYTGNAVSTLLAGTPVYHSWTAPPFTQDTRQSTCDGNYLTSRVQGVVYEDMTAPGEVIVAPDGVVVHRDDWTPITGATTLGAPGAAVYLHTSASAPFIYHTYAHVLEGEYLVRVGYAITQYDLMVATGFRIQL